MPSGLLSQCGDGRSCRRTGSPARCTPHPRPRGKPRPGLWLSTLAAQKTQGPLSTRLSGSQPRSWAAEHWPVRPSIMATGSPPTPGTGRSGQVAAWGEVPRVLHSSPVESPPLFRPQATPKLTLSFKQENFLPESYRPYLCKHSEKTPLAFLVKGVSLPAQWSI